MKVIVNLLIFIFFIGPFVKAEEVPLTLEEALGIGLRENRYIILGEEELRKAKVRIKESYAELYPSLSFLSALSLTDGYYSKDLRQNSLQVGLKQYLYTGGRIFNTIKYNGILFEISQASLDTTRIEIALQIKKAFYTLLLAQEYLSLNKILVENSQEHLNVIQERYKAGEVSFSELLVVQASFENLTQVYKSCANQVALAQEVLKNLLYLKREIDIKAQGDFTYEPKEVAFDEALLKALEERPEIRRVSLQIELDKRAIELAKSQSRPTIYASWDYYSKSHSASVIGANKNWNDYNLLGITFSWPVFDGWRAKYKVEQAIADLRKSQILKEKINQDIVLELKEAYLNLKDAIFKIKASESDLKLYEENLKVAEEKYKKGEVSLLGKSDAYAKFMISKFNRTQAVFDYLNAKASFEKASGGL